MSLRASRVFELAPSHPERVGRDRDRLVLRYMDWQVISNIANSYGDCTSLVEIGPRQMFGAVEARELARVLLGAADYKPQREQHRPASASAPVPGHRVAMVARVLPELAPEAKELCTRVGRYVEQACQRGLNVVRRMPNWKDDPSLQ